MSFESVKMTDPYNVIPKLQALSKTIPKDVERAQLRVVSIMVRKIRASIRGLKVAGAGALPNLSDLSRTLRDQKPGGLLSSETTLLRVLRRDNKMIAGFVEKARKSAELWQTGGTFPNSIHQRRRLHIALGRKGARSIPVPTVSIQPTRLVIDPLAVAFSGELHRWVLGALNKQINTKLARAHK